MVYSILYSLAGGGTTIHPISGEVIQIPPVPNGDATVTAAVRPIVNLGIGPQISGGSGTSSSPYVIAGKGASTYTITYNANGGSGAPAAQTVNVGTTPTLSTTVPSRSGFSFLSWNTAANGSGTSYAPGATYTGGASVTLYAQWGAGNYTATVTCNVPFAMSSLYATPTSGATGAYLDIYAMPGGSFNTVIPTVGGGAIRVGWDFVNWTSDNNTWTFTNANNNSTTVRVGTGNATLTANYYTWND